MTKLAVVLIALLPLTCPAFAQDEKQDTSAQDPAKPTPGADRAPDRAQLEKEFEKTMSGATLVGYFTISGREQAQPKEERYTIKRVTKQQGDVWLFLATMQYGGRELTVPMPIPVKWAGDTAVISVTDLGFPGMATYTARVLIYRGQYAGTWSSKNHGGHLWGRIERAGEGAENTGAAGEAPKAGREGGERSQN